MDFISANVPVNDAELSTRPRRRAVLTNLTTSEEQLFKGVLERLRALDRVVVAFSGGVDSSLVLAMAAEVLPGKTRAFTGVSESLSQDQENQARRVASFLGVPHVLLTTREIDREDYAANPPNRCFFCKDELYRRLRQHLKGEAVAILDGNNADDAFDIRPGMIAARSYGVISPLLDAGVDKKTVRIWSRSYELETADYPAAPCLASRIPFGSPVTREVLAQIEAAEAEVRRFGFREFRVRHFGQRARLELSATELTRASTPEMLHQIRDAVSACGFMEFELDPRPLVSGRLSRESAP